LNHHDKYLHKGSSFESYHQDVHTQLNDCLPGPLRCLATVSKLTEQCVTLTYEWPMFHQLHALNKIGISTGKIHISKFNSC